MASQMVSRRAASAAHKLRACFSPAADIKSRAMATAAAQVAPRPEAAREPSRDAGFSPRGRGRDSITTVAPFGVFADIWDPLTSSNRSLRQMLDTIDRFVDVPSAGSLMDRTVRSGVRTPWDILEKPDGFYMRVDMPGLDKSEVKISVEDEELVLRGEHKAEEGKEDLFGDRRSYNTRMILPKEVQKDQIKAELKNGVLTVFVPKMKPEDKKVTEIQIS